MTNGKFVTAAIRSFMPSERVGIRSSQYYGSHELSRLPDNVRFGYLVHATLGGLRTISITEHISRSEAYIAP